MAGIGGMLVGSLKHEKHHASMVFAKGGERRKARYLRHGVGSCSPASSF